MNKLSHSSNLVIGSEGSYSVLNTTLPFMAAGVLVTFFGYPHKSDCLVREDTHKKSVFFSGRTTKGIGRVNPPDH